MSKVCGVIQIKFKDGLSEEKVGELLEQFYLKNEDSVHSMLWSQMGTEKLLVDLHHKIDEWSHNEEKTPSDETVNEIKKAIKRVESGDFVGEEEFMKDSPLSDTQKSTTCECSCHNQGYSGMCSKCYNNECTQTSPKQKKVTTQ